MKLAKKWIVIDVIILMLLAAFFSGKILDQQAQTVVEKMYVRDADGIIKGLESKAVVHHYPNALLLLHGFGGSPEVFNDFIAAAEPNNKFDIYAPLLPYHGRNLQTFAEFNNEKIVKFVADDIKKLSQQYKNVTVLGFSYGGALLVELLKRNAIPANVKLILYAPSVYIKSNNFAGDLLLNTYSLWRKYCNYAALGCHAVSYRSGDSYARDFLEHQKTLRYVVSPAVKQLYEFDDSNRKYFAQIDHPFDLIMAHDDNHMSYAQIANICHVDHGCVLHAFPSGKHYLLLGKYKNEFNNLVVNIVRKNSNV